MTTQFPYKITFSRKYTKDILNALGKKIDSQTNQIIDSETHEPIESFEGFPIEAKDLGAIKIGSQIFYKKDIVSMLKLHESMRNNVSKNS